MPKSSTASAQPASAARAAATPRPSPTSPSVDSLNSRPERARRQLVAVEELAYRIDETGGSELDRRHVGPQLAQPDRRMRRQQLPAGPLGGALLEHPGRERKQQAGLVRDLEERVGRQQPAARVRPAHERFHADDATRSEVDLGLKVQDDLAALVRAAQVIGQIQIQHHAHGSPSIPRAPAAEPAATDQRQRAPSRHLSVLASGDEPFGRS